MGGAGLLAIALVYVVAYTVPDSRVSVAVSTVGNVVLAGFAGAMALAAAKRVPTGEAPRNRWTLIGLGLMSYVLGAVVVAYYDIIIERPVPHPGVTDALFAISAVAIAAAVIDAAASVRRFGSLTAPLVMALLVSLALFALLTSTMLNQVAFDAQQGWVMKALALYRPTSIVFLGVFPALLVAFSMRGSRLGMPWLPVAAGMILLAMGATVSEWLTAVRAFETGGVADLLSMCGYMSLAIGALIHMDVDSQSEPETEPEALAAEATEPEGFSAEESA